MKAAVFYGPKDIRIEEVPVPECGSDDVLIKVKRVGICGTDLHIYTGGFKIPTPQVIGHEFAGEVAAVGSGVRGIDIGEPVTAEHVIPCKKCRYCAGGEPNLCDKMTVIGVHLPGGMAEYVKVPAELVYKLPEKFTFDEGVLVEPLSISVYAVRNSGLKVGDTVAVIGLGPIGLFIAAAAKASGATVIGVDRDNARLEYAHRAGFVDHMVNSTDGGVVSRIVEIAGGIGVDVAFEVAGRQETAEQALEVTHKTGTVILIGVYEGMVTLDVMQILKKDLKVIGSWTASLAFDKTIALLADGRIDYTGFITHRYPLSEVKQALEDSLAHKGFRIKTVIETE